MRDISSRVPSAVHRAQTFLRAHRSALAGADLFTTEVLTWRGLVTFHTVVVIELASRPSRSSLRRRIPPSGACSTSRTLTAADDGLLVQLRLLIRDRVLMIAPRHRQFDRAMGTIRARSAACQQIRGSCSPLNISTIREVPSAVRSVT